MKQQHTKDTVYQLKSGADRYLAARNRQFKKQERMFTRKEVADYLGIDSRTVPNYVKQLGLDPLRHQETLGYSWALTISDVYQIRDALRSKGRFEPKLARTTEKLQVLLLQNQKGGVGKTVSAVTLASGLAVNYHEELRIGLIDLDGQSTATMYHATEAQANDALSVGDIICGNYELDEGESYKDVISDSFLPTLIPNLRMLPALQSDRSLESWFHEQLANGQMKDPYSKVKDIISTVEDEFDVIIIDTPPSLSFMTYNGYFAATSVIFPLAMTENDVDATCQYFSNLPHIWNLLESAGHQGYDSMRMLLTNHEATESMTALKTDMTRYFNSVPYQTPFNHSVAVMQCSTLMSSVFDMSASEYPKSKGSFTKAVENSKAVVGEIYENMILTWNEQRENSNNG